MQPKDLRSLVLGGEGDALDESPWHGSGDPRQRVESMMDF